MNVYPQFTDKAAKAIYDWVQKVILYRVNDIAAFNQITQEIQTLQADVVTLTADVGGIPTVAAGTDIDTGTNNSLYVTALALKNSKNVPDVAPGTAGNYMKSNGTNWISAAFPTIGLTLGTATAFNSAAAYNVTGLPAGIKQLIVNCQGVTWNAASALTFQIGDATGGLKTSGYISEASNQGGTTGSVTNGIGTTVGVTGPTILSGSITFNLVDAANFIWVATAIFTNSGGNLFYASGQVTLQGALDRVTVTTTGGSATWTAGKINIAYQ